MYIHFFHSFLKTAFTTWPADEICRVYRTSRKAVSFLIRLYASCYTAQAEFFWRAV